MNQDLLPPARPRRMRSPPPPIAADNQPSYHGGIAGGNTIDYNTTNNTTTTGPAIPLLKSTAASIFVPLTIDFAAPAAPADTAIAPAPSSNRIAQLNLLLADHDAHAVQVRANIRALVRRECIRLLREAAADEARLAPAPTGPGPSRPLHPHQPVPPAAPIPAPAPAPAPRHRGLLAPADRAAMILNMETSSSEAAAVEIIPLPDFSKSRPPANPHEWANKELMAAVSRAFSELKGFDAHVARCRAFHQQALRREIERAQ